MIDGSISAAGFLVVAVVLLIAGLGLGHTSELQPFVSDGCSVFPDGAPVTRNSGDYAV